MVHVELCLSCNAITCCSCPLPLPTCMTVRNPSHHVYGLQHGVKGWHTDDWDHTMLSYMEGHCLNSPGQSQVQGGVKLHNQSRRHLCHAKPYTDIRWDWGCAARESLIPCRGAAFLGIQMGSHSGAIVTNDARGHACLQAVQDFL